MESLLARFGKCIVRTGPLQGTAYADVSKEKILKAAKRYSGDPDFSKFARSYALLIDLADSDIPEPCMPIVPCSSQITSADKLGRVAWCKRFLKLFVVGVWKSKYCRWMILFACTALILRPAFSRMVSKVLVTVLRVGLRRIINLATAVFEGLLDELIYQLDHLIRDALPPGAGFSDSMIASFNWFSHLLSSSFGAAVALLVQFRRANAQIQ